VSCSRVNFTFKWEKQKDKLLKHKTRIFSRHSLVMYVFYMIGSGSPRKIRKIYFEFAFSMQE